jgi:hypothetical protein
MTKPDENEYLFFLVSTTPAGLAVKILFAKPSAIPDGHILVAVDCKNITDERELFLALTRPDSQAHFRGYVEYFLTQITNFVLSLKPEGVEKLRVNRISDFGFDSQIFIIQIHQGRLEVKLPPFPMSELEERCLQMFLIPIPKAVNIETERNLHRILGFGSVRPESLSAGESKLFTLLVNPRLGKFGHLIEIICAALANAVFEKSN